MEWTDVLPRVKEGLGMRLFNIGDTEITAGTFAVIAVIVFATLLLSRIIQRSLARIMGKSGMGKESTIQIAQRLTHYIILLGGFVAALQTIGIDLSTLFAAGALFAVGLGFAMQNITQNFVSGVILLVEQSIKPGDVLEVDGQVVRVMKMGIRSTVVRTRNQEELIVPNATLVQGMVKNFTLTDSRFLLRAEVGVVYDSDMKQVVSVLEQVAGSLPWRDQTEAPRVLMREFGDSSVNFSVMVPVNQPWIARRLLSELNTAIWWAFKEANIVIAFPQIDVHFDPPVTESFGLSRTA